MTLRKLELNVVATSACWICPDCDARIRSTDAYKHWKNDCPNPLGSYGRELCESITGGRARPEIDIILGVPKVIVGAPDKGREDLSSSTEGRAQPVTGGENTAGTTDVTHPSENQASPAQIFPPVREMYSMMLCRDYMEDEFEVLVEILDYHGKEQGGCWDEVIGPTIEMGDAFTLDGKQIELTELERERAAEGALEMIESRGRK